MNDPAERGIRLGRLLWRPLTGTRGVASPLAVDVSWRDGATAHCTLDDAARWSDGRPVTAADVAANAGLPEWEHVVAVADGPHSLRVSGPGARDFLARLIPVRVENGAARHGAGSGPYRLVAIAPERALLEPLSGHGPALEFVGVTCQDAALAQLRCGALDVILEADEEAVCQVLAEPGPAVVSLPDSTRTVQFLGFDSAGPRLPAASRRALARAALGADAATGVYRGLARPPSELPDFRPDTDADAAKATAPPTGGHRASDEPLELLVNEENRLRIETAHHVAARWAAAGTPTLVAVEPWPRFLARLDAGDMDCFLLTVREQPGLWSDRNGDGLLTRFTGYQVPADAGREEIAARVAADVPAVVLTRHVAWTLAAAGALGHLDVLAAVTGAPAPSLTDAVSGPSGASPADMASRLSGPSAGAC
ncbi:ABC transporter substrate-binding protein [Streptomyces sp. NPDC101158]|uniref:ABC transporter substrate-binding protein n=1 Tax=Streptomyces sp. NPDC101158 TaxID=3366117 RepID=UPI00380D0483